MKNRQIPLLLVAIVATVAIVFSACRKINDATELGGDLIPPIDNINTFDTLINVQAYNDTFGLLTDSQYLGKSEEYFLGRINNDPIFGKTDARIFFELKPSNYKYFFESINPDSLAIDSVVLVMGYLETIGDTNTAQTINVYEMDQSNAFKSDSSYLIRKNNFTYSNLLGSKSVVPKLLKDSVKVYKDTTSNQLRIRLNNSFGTRLLSYDSIASSLNGAYASDSAFRSKFKGFAVQSMGPGNAVMGFDLNSSNTKLAIYYRYQKNKPAFNDTTVAYFTFYNYTDFGCAAANFIQRDYAGTQILASLGGSSPDSLIYLQNSPGTFSILKIPDLPNLNNRVIHRAELIAEQVYDNSNLLFPVPEALFLNFYDTANSEYATSLYDFYATSGGSINYGQYGCFPKDKIDGFGRNVKEWRFNLSRYIQGILTKREKYYPLRLFSPFTTIFRYSIYEPNSYSILQRPKGYVGFNSSIVKGRVVIDSKINSPSRLRLRLIYSKL